MLRALVVLALLALGACAAAPSSTSTATTTAVAPARPQVEQYIGPYENGLRSGEGIYTWADGRKYVGTFRAGLPNGHGTYTLANGDTFEGQFRDNLWVEGTYSWRDGRKYTGPFRDNKPNGVGTYTWPDGKRYVGDWRDGHAEGNGTYTWPDERRYTGAIRDDLPNGRGTMLLADGRQQTGEFRNGDYLGPAGTVQTVAASGEVALERRGGTFLVPALLNDSVSLDFYLDSGAADVSVPPATFEALKRAGTIRTEDIIGTENYLMANGASNKATLFTIRTLKVGSTVLKNVRGSVSDNAGPPLLGMSFLGRFSSWTVDNTRSFLVLR